MRYNCLLPCDSIPYNSRVLESSDEISPPAHYELGEIFYVRIYFTDLHTGKDLHTRRYRKCRNGGGHR